MLVEAKTAPMKDECAKLPGYLCDFLAEVRERNPHETEFNQAVEEVVSTLAPALERHPKYMKAKILDRLVEPERMVQFRVPWVDDRGEIQVHRGWRVQFSSALGPYKGGLRFHRTVTPSVLKFLGFEQIFKNALTMRPIGGGKGGSNFDPKNRSDAEVMRFCQSFMTELFRHIGADTDVPAGDIGVGGREIGYLFGQYKRLANQFNGVLTGKGVGWGGSLIRTEATGYGVVYFAAAMLEARGQSLHGCTCLVSGAGNVAQHTCEKLIDLGAKPITMSDSGGFIHDPEGISREKLEWIKALKNERRGRMAEYIDQYPKAEYTHVDPEHESNPLWQIDASCAFPCATQNEINARDAQHLVEGGVTLLVEGANMPVTPGAIDVLLEEGVLYAPGKASNAGGVAVSALEMTQNSTRAQWSRAEVDDKLKEIMQLICKRAADTAEAYGQIGNYATGANIAGFLKVADAMLDQGVV